MKYTSIVVSLFIYGYASAMDSNSFRLLTRDEFRASIEKLESQVTACISLDDFINHMQQPTWIGILRDITNSIVFNHPEYRVYQKLVEPLAQRFSLQSSIVVEYFKKVEHLKSLLAAEFHGNTDPTPIL